MVQRMSQRKTISKRMLSEDNIDTAKARTRAALLKARSKVVKAKSKVKTYAKKNPRKTALIAAGAIAATAAGVAMAMRRRK